MNVPTFDITRAAREFWLSTKNCWSVEDYKDVTPLPERVRFTWRVPETVNVNGERWLQRGPLSWTADVWRVAPSELQDVPWEEIEENADQLAAALDRAAARGGTGFALAQVRNAARALRRDPNPVDLLRLVGLFEAAAHVLLIRLRSHDPILPGLPSEGLLAFFVGRSGGILPHSRSTYVVSRGVGMDATELKTIGDALELSVHPVLLALDALNTDRGELDGGALVLRRQKPPELPERRQLPEPPAGPGRWRASSRLQREAESGRKGKKPRRKQP